MKYLMSVFHSMKIDKKMIPMKIHYFLFSAATAPFALFGPTIAKQLGYSAVVVGSIYTVLPIATMFMKPALCILSDKYKLRRMIFLLSLIANLLADLFMIFVPERQIHLQANLLCDREHLRLTACEENIKFSSNVNKFLAHGSNINCRLECEETAQFKHLLCSTWNVKRYCDDNLSSNEENTTSLNDTFNISENNRRNFSFSSAISSLYLNESTNCIDTEMSYVKFEDDNVTYLVRPVICDSNMHSSSTLCKVKCDNVLFMELMNPKERNVLLKYEFWVIFILYIVFFSSMCVNICLSDTVCFELLGSESQSYGYTRMYSSFGWGISSIFCGWLTDKVSDKSGIKNYAPILMIAMFLMVCDMIVSLFVHVSQEQYSSNLFSDIGKLFKNVRIISFTICCFYVGICTALIWQFLFWHLEDISTADDLTWSKTLQGLDAMVSTFFSEIPALMLSGWIIKKFGHVHTMALVLLAMATRMSLYSLLKRPIWTLPIDLLSGLTFALFYVDMTSYASLIAPPGTEATTQSLFGSAFDGFGTSLGSLIGGFLYDRYKGSTMYLIFAISSLIVFLLHIALGVVTPNIIKTP